jgi:hypothetical protein
MKADELLKHYTAEIDKIICDGAVQMAQQLLDAGTSVDDLPAFMRPVVQQLAERRAKAVAKLRANTDRMRIVEAQLELLESGTVVH